MRLTVLLKFLRQLGRGRKSAPQAPPDLSAIPALVHSGALKEAERQLDAFLALHPGHPDALHYLGLLHHQTSRTQQALRLLGAAVEAAPADAFLRANYAEVLRAAGYMETAEQQAREAMALDPGSPVAAFNLAAVLCARNAPADGLAPALQALEAEPDSVARLTLAATLYIALDRRLEAQALLERARKIEPDNPSLVILSLRNRAWLCDWQDRGRGDSHANPAALLGVLERWAAQPLDASYAALNPFVAYEYPVAQDLRDAVTQAHANAILRRATSSAAAPGALGAFGVPQPRRLRIAYLSADFHNHPTMHLMRGLFARHDRKRFEIIAYSIGADDGSSYRRDALRDVERFVDISAELPASTAARMREDGIDILVDLKGYTHEARPEILALRPAPLRVAWLGYPASTGRGLNDYVIVDRVVAPPEQQLHYGEQLVWMPHSYQVNDDTQAIATAAPTRTELGLPAQGFVFACFNHVYKIEPRMFATWMRILGRVPGSVLWLYCTSEAASANLGQAAAAAGVAPRRLVFAGTAPKPQHLARMRQADLFLDTLWINAHTGASDALWAGVPLLTCPQDSFASRVAASVLTAAGLPQLACNSLQAYEDKAVALAMEPGRKTLQALRAHLQSGHEKLPLFDTARFVRNLEQAYEQMWQRHAAGLPPVSFAVKESVSGDRSD